MLGIEISFYFIGFLTCLLLVTIIEEVIDKDNKLQRKSKRMNYEIKKQIKIKTNRKNSKIDID